MSHRVRLLLGPSFLTLILISSLGASSAAFAAPGKVESIGQFADQSASESVRKALEPKGYRVTGADGGVICDVWLRNGAPAGKGDTPGAVYALADSSLVGVIAFPKNTTDFRGQTVKAGSYTLRYAVHPADGNHLGISPIRDFLLLAPVAVDQNADAQFKFEDLSKMSAKASGTNHPAPLSLVSPDAGASAPAVTENERGNVILVAKLKTQAGAAVPIAFIVKGVIEQ